MVDVYYWQMSGYQQFVFNLTSNVGTKSPNKPDDIALVQLGFLALAKSKTFGPSPADQAVFGAVEWTGQCTGEEDDLLIKAIRYFQKVAPNGVRDGHVSTLKDHEPVFHMGGATKGVYIMTDLLSAIIEVHKDIWPNIHRIPGCPPVLASKVALMLTDPGWRPSFT